MRPPDARRGILEPTNEATGARDPDFPAIQKVLAGETAAFAELVQSHEGVLRRVVTGLVADTHVAEDVLQEVFLIAYRKLPDFRGEAPFGAWLYRIAVREAGRARSRWRKVWRLLSPLERADLEARQTRAEQLEAPPSELAEALSALERLPRRARAAFVLHVVEELSYEEIGRVLDCSSGTVGSLIHRARAKLESITGPPRDESAEGVQGDAVRG